MKKSKVNNIVLILILLLTLNNNFYTQWTKVNISQGGYSYIACKDSLGFIYTLARGTLYRSSNDGNTWNDLGFVDLGIMSFILSGDFLLMGTSEHGIYRSSNQGLTWASSNNGLPVLNNYSMIIHNNQTFAAMINGLYRTTDFGVSWSLVNSIIRSAPVMGSNNTFLFAQSDPPSTSEYMMRSSDNGISWDTVNNGLPDEIMTHMTYCNNSFYVGGYYVPGLYYTNNNGYSWQLVPGTPTNRALTSLTSYSNILLAGFYDTLYLSSNAGLNWSKSTITNGTSFTSTLLLNGNTVLAGTSKSVFKTTNFGLSWDSSYSGIFSLDFLSTAAIGNYVLAGSSDGGMFWSSDKGATWNFIASLSQYTTINSIQAAGANFYARSGTVLLRSSNYGLNWTNIPGPPQSPDFSNFYAKDSILFVKTSSIDGLYLSTNYGNSWQFIVNGIPLPIYDANSMLVKGNVLICCLRISGNSGRIYRSSDMGNSWTLVYTNTTNYSFLKLADGGNVIFLGFGGGILASTDGGITWLSRSNGLSSNTSVTDFVVSGDTVYASSTNYGIFKSTNKGNNWLQYNNGLGIQYIRALSASNNRMYAAAFGSFWKTDAIVSTQQNNKFIPETYKLYQNYPNPFNPSTTIEFDIPFNSFVTLKVYNMLGAEICAIVNKMLYSGKHRFRFNSENMSSGIYYYKLKVNNFTNVKKMVLIR